MHLYSHAVAADLTDALISAALPEIGQGTHPKSRLRPRALARLISPCTRILSTEVEPRTVAELLLDRIPTVRAAILSDATAIYHADPAATSTAEVLACYPSLYAIAVYRLAHVIYTDVNRALARMLSTHAQRTTAIDIHPGAQIGDSLAIDHGVGIVIGETAVIGSHVTLYHGVTLGTKAFTDPSGNLLRGVRRHPTVCDGTLIYTGATVLGGDTVVGKNCTVGAHALVTSSIPDGTTVHPPRNK